MVGARRYRLIVSKQADFRSTYDDLYSEYWRYTPYTPGSWDAYANGVYYWKVEAWSSADAVIATSEVLSFTLQQPIQLSNPEDGAGLVAYDPDFDWAAIAGAHRYRLLVSKYADFRSLFDSVYTDYNRYTPYTAGTVNTYPAGTYYWKVEAWNSGDAVIATSGVRRFVKRL
jgi:hypothetical protein